MKRKGKPNKVVKKRVEVEKAIQILPSRVLELIRLASDGKSDAAKEILATEFPEAFAGRPAGIQNTDHALPPLELEDPTDMVDTKAYIFEAVYPLLERLHKAEPNHALFGVAETGVMR